MYVYIHFCCVLCFRIRPLTEPVKSKWFIKSDVYVCVCLCNSWAACRWRRRRLAPPLLPAYFYPLIKQEENVPSAYSITAWRLCWGSICFPWSQKGPSVLLSWSLSQQREDFLDATRRSPPERLWFLIRLYPPPVVPSPRCNNAGEHPKVQRHRWRGLMSTFGKFKSAAKCRWRQTVSLIQLHIPPAFWTPNAITLDKLPLDFVPRLPQTTRVFSQMRSSAN